MTVRARIVRAVAVVLVLLTAAWYQRTTMPCEDALIRRRAETERLQASAATRADVTRYCLRWGF